jgi:hypothetical protein
MTVELAAAARLACIEKELDDCLLIGDLLVGDTDAPKQVGVAFPMGKHFDLLLGKETARRSGKILMDLSG